MKNKKTAFMQQNKSCPLTDRDKLEREETRIKLLPPTTEAPDAWCSLRWMLSNCRLPFWRKVAESCALRSFWEARAASAASSAAPANHKYSVKNIRPRMKLVLHTNFDHEYRKKCIDSLKNNCTQVSPNTSKPEAVLPAPAWISGCSASFSSVDRRGEPEWPPVIKEDTETGGQVASPLARTDDGCCSWNVPEDILGRCLTAKAIY